MATLLIPGAGLVDDSSALLIPGAGIVQAGAATIAAVASAAGTGTAAGVGASTWSSVAASVGAATAEAVGSVASTIVEAAASATGAATVSGIGAATAASVGASTGAATASGAGSATAAGVGAVAGAATVAGSGAAIAAAVGAAAGSATAEAVGYEAQMVRPASDVSAGAWLPSSGSDLFAMLDETPYSDADYIYTASASAARIGLASANDPGTHTGHIVRYRAKGNDINDLIVKLLSGTTQIAIWTEAAATSTETTYVHTLTEGEAANIADYSALRLEFEAA